jgi:alkanesulfonate monooxygenase SsuD/methylene tetrahydromethanopterin reductase-like flavin-dependent oxidoreductase (luciferase family)
MPIALGLALDDPDPRRRVEIAREAEALGCESLWLSPSAGEDGLAALTALALATRRLRVGIWGHALADRHPLVSAGEIAAADLACAGRVELGLRDAGGPALGEAITVCKKLWSDPSVEHRGACFALDETTLGQRPVQKPWPRLHLAGDSDEALYRAARMGDGWIAVGHSPTSIGAPLRRLRELRARAETLDGRFQVTARAGAVDPAELARWHAAGVERVIVTLEALRALA